MLIKKITQYSIIFLSFPYNDTSEISLSNNYSLTLLRHEGEKAYKIKVLNYCLDSIV
jgi:hypothetical protein